MNKRFRQLSDFLCGFRFGVGVALVGLSLSAPAANREFFVAPEGDDVNNDGLSWASPFKTINHAVALQNDKEYLTVTISNGTYKLTEPIVVRTITDSAYGGGVRLRSFSGKPADTIIDGDNRCACVWSAGNQQRNCFESLTFQNGLSTELEDKKAGGIYTEQRCFISNCVVRNCSHVLTNGTHKVDINGGGLKINNYAGLTDTVGSWGKSPAIVDTLIEDCAVVSKTSGKTGVYGGGAYVTAMQLHNVTIRRCSVTNETASLSLAGGGLYAHSCIVSNCTIVGNSLVIPSNTSSGIRGVGAGVWMGSEKTDPSTGRYGLLIDSVVAENMTSGSGAGVYADVRSHLVRVAITNNVSGSTISASDGTSKGGGALAISGNEAQVADWTVIEDCLIEGNDFGDDCAHYGGGVSIYDINCVRLSGTVIRNNRACTVGGLNIINGTGIIVTNCVITGNATTNEMSAIYLRNNIFKIKGTEVAGSAARNKPVQIVDSFVIANTNSRPSSKTTGGGFFTCSIGDLAPNKTEYRVAYVTPVLLRNCLFANNQDNVCQGWCFRFGASSEADRLAHFEGWEERPVVVDHCTVAGNRNSGSWSTCVIFAGSSASSSNTAFRSCVFTDNLYYSASANPRKAVMSNSYKDASPEIVRTYGDQEDDCLKVTPENGNIVGGDVRFADAANGDYALLPGSCLIDKGGAFADWMGDGRRRSPSRDLSGGYVISANGPYGVTVSRPNSKPRRGGSASDIGCCEFWQAPGALLFLR